jgi:hypothetical protein
MFPSCDCNRTIDRHQRFSSRGSQDSGWRVKDVLVCSESMDSSAAVELRCAPELDAKTLGMEFQEKSRPENLYSLNANVPGQ